MNKLLVLCCFVVGGYSRELQPLVLNLTIRLQEQSSRCVAHSVTSVSCTDLISSDALLAHPDDCQLFYYCEPGREEPTCRECPGSLHFNPALHVCDWPQNAGCTTSSINNETPSSNVTWPWINGTISSNNTDIPLIISINVVSPPGSPTSNRTWLYNGTTTNSTINSTNWSSSNNKSSNSVNSRGNIQSRCEAHSVTPVSCTNLNSSDALLAHPDDCQLFYYCEPGRDGPTCRECPGSLHFNPALHVCDWPQNAGCTAQAPTTTSPVPTTVSPSNTTEPAFNSTTTPSINNVTAPTPPSNETWA